MQKIGIIVNFNSRKNKRAKRDPVKVLQEAGGDHVIVRATHSLDDITTVAEEFRQAGISYFATSGGDGTIHHVLSRFIHVYGENHVPPLLILKGGTMNNISKSINLKGDGIDILKRAVALLKKGDSLELHRRDTMKINDLYCFLFGNGITAAFLQELYDNGKTYTKILQIIYQCIREATLPAAKTKLLRGVDGNAGVDGETLPFDHFLGILAGTVEDVGMGFSPLSRANSENGTFHIIINGMKPSEAVRNIHRLKRGRAIDHPMNFDGTVREIHLNMDAPFSYTMDGDLYRSEGQLHVATGPPVMLAKA